MDNLYDINSYDYLKIKKTAVIKHKRGVKGKKRQPLKNLWCAFDIETSRLKEDSFMYVWQFQIEDDTIIGRTWQDFKIFVKRIHRALGDKNKLVVWVHNLSYEFQFLSGIFEVSDVFAVSKRKVLKCNIGQLEFRCSYLQTNMKLEDFTHKMGVPDAKLSGYDYDKIRYPWTPLSEDELLYCINDVRGLVQALKVEASIYNDTIESIPLTSTGYVRREVKRAMQKFNYWQLQDQMPTYHIYKLLRKAFRGGNTHANRFYAGQIVEHVHSKDRASSYPAEITEKMYPCSHFWELPKDECTFERLVDLMEKGKACLINISFVNIRLKDKFCGFPYLSESKCDQLIYVPNQGEPSLSADHVYRDNGRVLKAHFLTTVITDVDMLIINDIYEWDDVVIHELAYARYRKLPSMLLEVVQKLFEDKTALKGIDEQELYYMLQKAMLNATYGLSAQDPGKPELIYGKKEGEDVETFYWANDITEEEFNKRMRKAFMSYQWAPWVTAWARYELHKAMMIVGHDFVYADTDSVKYVGDHERDFEIYNNNIIRIAKKCGSYAADKHGVVHYMGVYEDEGTSEKFKTLGAKKYCYIKNNELILTCAGVAKKAGAQFLQEHGGIEAFDIGFCFSGKSGGLEAKYNDSSNYHIDIEGRDLHITKNVCLLPSTYTVGITADYDLAIREAHELLMQSI